MGFHSLAEAAPVAFKAPVELTEPVSLHSAVQVDGNGDGTAELTGYDEQLKKLVSSLGGPEGNQPDRQRRLIHAGDLSEVRSPVFLCDIDGDGNVDVTVQDGRKMVWWKHVPGAPLSWQGIWAGVPEGRTASAVADMDKDGNPDLLLPPQDFIEGNVILLHPPLIGYGGPGGTFEWLQLPGENLLVNSSFSPVDVDGDGNLDWAYDGAHLALLQGRAVVRMVDLPAHTGYQVSYQFADMDGGAGAELVGIEGYSDNRDHAPDFVNVFRLDGASWREITSFPLDSWIRSADPNWVFRGATIARQDPASPSKVFVLLDKLILFFGLGESELEVHGGGYHMADLSRLGDFRAITTSDRYRQDLFLRLHPEINRTEYGWVAGGIPQWTRIDMSSGNVSLTPATWNHYSRSIAVVHMTDGPKIASLGSIDKKLHLWTSPSGPAARRTLAVTKESGIGLLSGHFRGPAGPDVREELAFLSSTEDSARGFTAGAKTSYLTVGGPYLNNGSGINWRREQTIQGFMPAVLLGKGDFDADGKDDLLYTDSVDGMMVWRSGIESENFQGPLGSVRHEVGYMPLISPGAKGVRPQHVAIRDFDGDGDEDIVQFPSIFGNTPALFVNDGTGKFTPRRLVEDFSAIPPANVEYPVGIAAGNFGGSGLPDLAIITNTTAGAEGNYQRLLRIRIVRGGENSVTQTSTLPGSALLFVAADFNGDGLDDLVYETPTTTDLLGNTVWSDGCRILARKDHVSFHQPAIISSEVSFSDALAAADLNGDGKADLVQGSSATGQVFYLESTAADSLPTFAAWAATNGVSGDDVDSDGDGATDYHEYLTGRNPRVGETAPTSTGGPGEVPVIRVLRNTDFPIDTVFNVHAVHPLPVDLPQGVAKAVFEESYDLRTWTPVPVLPKMTLIEAMPGWQECSWDLLNQTLPHDGSGRFYRLRAWIE